jgi:hypothetical protein
MASLSALRCGLEPFVFPTQFNLPLTNLFLQDYLCDGAHDLPSDKVAGQLPKRIA